MPAKGSSWLVHKKRFCKNEKMTKYFWTFCKKKAKNYIPFIQTKNFRQKWSKNCFKGNIWKNKISKNEKKKCLTDKKRQILHINRCDIYIWENKERKKRENNYWGRWNFSPLACIWVSCTT